MTGSPQSGPLPPPEVAFTTDFAGFAPEGGTFFDGMLLFELVRFGDVSLPTTVRFEVAGDVFLPTAIRVGDGGPGTIGLYEVTFQPGEDWRPIEVVAFGDTVFEPDELVTLQLVGVTDFGSLSPTGPLNASGVFLNDDPPPPEVAFSFADAGFVPEGTFFDGVLLFELVRFGDVSLPTTVRFEVAGDVAADDILLPGAIRVGDGSPGSLGLYEIAFAAGSPVLPLEVIAVGDTVVEADEIVSLRLVAVTDNGTLAPSGPLSASGIVLNDDLPPPEVAFGAADVGATAEGTVSDGVLYFDVVRFGNVQEPTVVRFEIAGGTVSPNDIYVTGASFVGPGGPASDGAYEVTFLPFDFVRPIQVSAVADMDFEPDETVVLQLVEVVWNGTLAPGGLLTTRGVFVNDDPAISDLRLEIAAQTLAPDLGGTSAVTLQVTNDGPNAGSAIVRLDLPAGVVALDASLPGFDLSNGIWDTGVIAEGGSIAINVTLRFDLEGTPLVAAEIAAASNPDPDSTPDNGPGEDDRDTLSFTVTNAPPTDIALSNATLGPKPAAGTLVGLVSGTDPNPGDALTFDFASGGDAGGRFALLGNRLETAVPLPTGEWTVTLRVTDPAGGSWEESFVVAVGRTRTGSDAAERLAGTAGNDVLDGRDGGDRLVARDGDDLVIGGAGSDNMLGEDGNDELQGGEGDDRVVGGAGNDLVEGGTGDDNLLGDEGDDTLLGGTGSDRLVGGAGADVVEGGTDEGTVELVVVGGVLRARVTAPDQINLRAPGTLLPDDAADVVRYAAGLDGVDRVLGFEAGVDVLEIALGGETAVIQAVQGGTWVGFAAAPGGVLLVGVAGLTAGTDLVFV